MAAGPVGSTSGFGVFADRFLADFFPDFFFGDGLFDGLLLLLRALVLVLLADDFPVPDFALGDPVTFKIGL